MVPNVKRHPPQKRFLKITKAHSYLRIKRQLNHKKIHLKSKNSPLIKNGKKIPINYVKTNKKRKG